MEQGKSTDPFNIRLFRANTVVFASHRCACIVEQTEFYACFGSPFSKFYLGPIKSGRCFLNTLYQAFAKGALGIGTSVSCLNTTFRSSIYS
jgi:hypothetical protein